VNDDGYVTPMDAVVIVGDLRNNGGTMGTAIFRDNGDSHLSVKTEKLDNAHH
jgi:hypothetical protein